jgi:hypothetical protein
MFFRTMFRVFSRARSNDIRAWVRENIPHDIFNTSPGRWCTDVTWRQQLRQDISQENEDTLRGFAEILWDIRKAFEHVGRQKLIELGTRAGYPMHILKMSLLNYEWARTIVYEGYAASTSLNSTRGVAAGGAFAAQELMLYLYEVALTHRQICPEVSLCIHVDDISLATEGANDEDVIDKLLQAAENMSSALKLLGLPLAADKAYTMANSEKNWPSWRWQA